MQRAGYLAVRQWVLSVPKRLRSWMQRDGAVLNMVLRILPRVIAQSLQSNCPVAAQVNRAALHIGVVAFIHPVNSSLNGHVHFHVCAGYGVFKELAVAGDTDAQSSPPGIVCHLASAIDETAVAQVQTDLRRRIPSAPSLAGTCWSVVTPKTRWPTSTAASQWTPVYSSKHTTAQHRSGC